MFSCHVGKAGLDFPDILMARAKTSEPSRVRSKVAAIEELTRGIGELQEFLAQVADLGREGFPYLDAARARTDLQFRECIRRTFGEKSKEFQEHSHHRLLMDTPEETRQSIALIKTLIATLEQKKLDQQGVPPPRQVSSTPPVPPMPTSPQMTIVPASISTVQMTMMQTGPITPPPVAVAMTTNLGSAPATAVPTPPPAPPASSQKLEPQSPSTSLSEPSPISPAQTVTAMPHNPPHPVVRIAPEPQPPPSQVVQPTQADLPPAGKPPQPPRPEPVPTVHPIPSAGPQPKMQEAPTAPPHLQSHPPMPISSSSPQEAPPSHAQAGLDPVGLVKTVCCRFHSVARQLRLRGEYRATLNVEDEIDVQDLLHALLRIQFDDIGTEEWTPSYAEGVLRTTFLLDDNRLAVLVKKTRNGLTAKDLTEQLRIDTERYRTKSRCTSLLCFIYDPDGRIGNPRALEASLTTVSDSLTIDVLVAPK